MYSLIDYLAISNVLINNLWMVIAAIFVLL
jgi:hypothetical protein